MERLLTSLVAIILFCLSGPLAFAGSGVTYHGRLVKSDGTPVEESVVQFKLQIRTPGAESCLLYSETHTLDMTGSSGIFAITINDGTASTVNTEPFSLDRAFQNRGTFTFAGGKCSVGNTYSPNPADGRKLVVSFNDGTFAGFESLPAQAINFVPMSMESMTVGGYGSGSMLRVNDGTGAPAAISALTQTQYNTFTDLIAGTSPLYLTSASSVNGANLAAGSVDDTKIASGITGSKVSGNISGNAAGFTGSLTGDVTGSQSATVVGKIQGRAVDSAAPTNGQVLKWNAGNSRWEPTTLTSSGGTVTSVTGTGAVVMTGTATDPIVGVQDASTSQKGAVQLSANGGTTAGQVVQADDSRLSNARTPTAHHHNVDEIDSAVGKYLTYKPNNAQCADGQVIKWILANQRWECANDAGAAGTVASLTANSPLVKTGTSSDPIITVQDASTSQKGAVQLATNVQTTAGLVVQADDARLSDSRAPNGTATGDLTNSYPNPTVAKIRGVAVDATAPTTAGQVLRYDGTSKYEAKFLSLADIRSTVTVGNTMFPASTCSSSQTLTWSSLTDTMTCSNITGLNASVISAGQVPIANGGTGAATQQAAMNALAGTQASGKYLRSDGTNTTLSNISAADVPTLNQNTTGTAANVTGVVAVANGGSGQTTQQAAINALTGTQASGKYLRSDGTNATLSNISAADVPTLNQNTTGTAANVTGTVAIANGGSGQTTQQAAINALTGTQASGKYLRSDGTNATLSNISAADIPTLNQNTTGTAANVTGVVAVANGGTGTSTGSITGTGALTFTAGGFNQNVSLVPSGTGYTVLGGSVGIGTTAPNSALDVNGTIRATQICDGSGANCKTISGGWGSGGSANVQEFTSSGTWTKPSGTFTKIECWGGGGGGARAASTVGGGGGGAYNFVNVPTANLGATETVTIGAGGVGSATNANGGVGGNTTFGSWLTAYGGAGGQTNGTGGGGGGTLNPGSGGLAGAPQVVNMSSASYGSSSSSSSSASCPWYGGCSGGVSVSTTTTTTTSATYANFGDSAQHAYGFGGAGGASSAAAAGKGLQGGGGGGGCSGATARAAGVSTAGGGNGGAANCAAGVATAGSVPGGGGGGSINGTSGAGGSGKCRVTTW